MAHKKRHWNKKINRRCRRYIYTLTLRRKIRQSFNPSGRSLLIRATLGKRDLRPCVVNATMNCFVALFKWRWRSLGKMYGVGVPYLEPRPSKCREERLDPKRTLPTFAIRFLTTNDFLKNFFFTFGKMAHLPGIRFYPSNQNPYTSKFLEKTTLKLIYL